MKRTYSNYSEWKRWDTSFTFDTFQDIYFSGEFKRLPMKNKNLLDIGFGNGSFLAWAKSKGANVVGVEIIEEFVKLGKEKEFDVFTVDGFEPQAYKEYLDIIVVFDVFEHLTETEMFDYLLKCEGMLKQSGNLILRFPNGASPFGRMYQHNDLTHIQTLTPSKLQQAMIGTRLTIVEARDPFFAVVSKRGLHFTFLKYLQYILRRSLFWTLSKIVGLHTTHLDPNCILVITKK